MELCGDGRGVHHFAFRFAGVDGHAFDGDRGGRRVEGLILEFAQRAAVDGVRHIGAELVEVEERGAFADLLVGRERDGDAPVPVLRLGAGGLCRLDVAEQHFGAEQRGTVGRDERFALVLEQFRELLRREHQRCVAGTPDGRTERDVRPVVVADELRADVGAGGLGRRVHVGDEPDDFVGVARRRDGGVNVVVFFVVDDVLGVHRPELFR